ncbi:MAG: hypothetical protein KH116_13630 [Clostridium sp.]|nr:hypothetical protein [Clostridium sp.]
MTAAEVFGVLKDTVVMAASGTGIYVAIKGLSTWKRQIKGQSEYALAKETLINVYKLRDEIINVRHPAMTIKERPELPADKIQTMTADQIRHHSLREAYRKRWDKVITANSTLSVNLIEAEAMWDSDLKTLSEKLFRHQNYLVHMIDRYLSIRNPELHPSARDSIAKESDKIHEVVFNSLDDNDQYNKTLNEHIKPIEEYLKKKMRN